MSVAIDLALGLMWHAWPVSVGVGAAFVGGVIADRRNRAKGAQLFGMLLVLVAMPALVIAAGAFSAAAGSTFARRRDVETIVLALVLVEIVSAIVLAVTARHARLRGVGVALLGAWLTLCAAFGSSPRISGDSF